MTEQLRLPLGQRPRHRATMPLYAYVLTSKQLAHDRHDADLMRVYHGVWRKCTPRGRHAILAGLCA